MAAPASALSPPRRPLVATPLSSPPQSTESPGRYHFQVVAPASPHQIAVATDVLVRSDAVRRRVRAIGEDAQTEVLLWDRPHPTSRRFVAVRHQPSAAALVFESCALAAGGAAATGPADEGFYSMA